MMYFIIILSCVVFCSEKLNEIESLFIDGKYIESKLMYEEFNDDSPKSNYIGYQIYYQLDDLSNTGKLLYMLYSSDEEKYDSEYNNFKDFYDQLTSVNITIDQGYYDDAIVEYEKLLISYPNNSNIFYKIGVCYKKKKEYDKAVQFFSKAKASKPYVSKYNDEIRNLAKGQAKLGQDEFKRQDYQAALNYYEKSISFDSTYAVPMFGIGNVFYRIKDYEKAIDYYKQGIVHADLSPHKYRRLYQLGVFFTKVNNNDKAIESFDAALELKPGYTKAMFEKAKISRSLGDVKSAKMILLQTIDIDPSYEKAFEELMDIEIESNNFDSAISHGERCLDFNPKSSTVKYRFAKLYNIIEDYSKAKKYAKEAISGNRKYAAALYELGFAEMNLCNKVAAKDAFNKSKSDRNFRKEASAMLKQLDQRISENCD